MTGACAGTERQLSAFLAEMNVSQARHGDDQLAVMSRHGRKTTRNPSRPYLRGPHAYASSGLANAWMIGSEKPSTS